MPWFRNAVLQDEQSRAMAASATDTSETSAEDPRAFMREVFRDGAVEFGGHAVDRPGRGATRQRIDLLQGVAVRQ